MYQTKISTAVFASVAFWLCSPSAEVVNAQDIASTPAGKILTQLIESVNHAEESELREFLKEGFLENDEATLKRRLVQTQQVKSQFGELTVDKVMESSANQISAACSTSLGPDIVLSLTVSDEKPHKIKSIQIEMGGAESTDDSALEAEELGHLINRLTEELRSKYVYPKVGEKMAKSLESSLKEGDYSDVANVRELASKLTDQLREICNDKHLRIRSGTPRRPSQGPGRRQVDNHGFVKAEMLPGGIGYLKFNYFSGDEEAKATAAAAMNFLGNSNSLIFDLRDNGGGSPEMIAFLSSYLFDEPVHLNSFYNRPTDTTTETWTQQEVPGKKFSPDTQVFVLTSSYTFSGAEEFSYNLRNLKRGTIVGETTGGGAHPVMPVALGKRMHITMPFARAINPITETNWEGVGVKPHVEVASADALKKAIEIARSRSSKMAANKSKPVDATETANVDIQALAEKAAGLMNDGSFAEAATVFEKLTRLSPDRGPAWFNYGYCLHVSGEVDKAIPIHQKAAEFERFAGIATYNLACAYSLKNETDQAFAALEKAIDLGFGDVSQLDGDSDLDNVRKDKRYADIIEKLKGSQ